MPANAALNGSLLDLVLQAGLVAKVVLAILALFSILSWALIVEKWLEFRRVRRESMRFLGVFRDKVVREARSLGAALGAAKRHRESPLAQLYVAACHEAGAGDGMDHGLEDWEEGAPPERLEAANRAMRRAAAGEVARLERYLPFLATTASAAPFIGLFGTVWGVMAAFHGIGQQGSASLAVVAPGISEALIATAAGLGAAIPAVMGYNFFVNRVKHWATEMEGFTLDLLNLLARPAPKGARVSGKDGL